MTDPAPTRTVTVAPEERIAWARRVTAGELSLERAAARAGVEPAEVESWVALFRAGFAAAPTRRRAYDSVLEAVGETPLVRLRNVVAGLPGTAFAKLELMNPTGSSKDRVARHMLREAARAGLLRPGDVVVEASSGNTALGLGMVAAQEGYRCKVVVRDRTSPDKVRALEALGVAVERVNGALPPEHPESYGRVMERVVQETPDCYFPDQHNNRANNAAHYATTGPELWDQVEGRLDVLVCGVGTGGTLGGVARYLKERDPGLRVVGVDSEGSIFSHYFRTGRPGRARPYLLEGLGDEEPVGCVEWELIDDFVQVTDREAFLAARELARREGIFAGGSSGACLVALRRVLAALGPEARVATIFPDSGHRYLSTIYDDPWMRERGFLEGPGTRRVA